MAWLWDVTESSWTSAFLYRYEGWIQKACDWCFGRKAAIFELHLLYWLLELSFICWINCLGREGSISFINKIIGWWMLGMKILDSLINLYEITLLNRCILVQVYTSNSNGNEVDITKLLNDSYMRTHNPPRILKSQSIMTNIRRGISRILIFSYQALKQGVSTLRSSSILQFFLTKHSCSSSLPSSESVSEVYWLFIEIMFLHLVRWNEFRFLQKHSVHAFKSDLRTNN